MTTWPELKKLADEAQARFEALSPAQQAIHRYEQRRSFVRGMCPSSSDYKTHCAQVDKLLPPVEGFTETEALVTIAKALSR